MIKIYQGTQKQIDNRLHQISQEHPAFICLYSNTTFPAGWAGIRMMIHSLQNQFGEVVIQEVLAAHKPVRYVLFPEQGSNFTPEEQSEYQLYKAWYESRLNVPYGLFDAVARLLEDLVSNRSITLLLPDLTNIDSESLKVIEAYYRAYPETKLDVLLGFATDITDVVDSDGITWHRSEGTVQYLVGGMQLYDTAKVIPLGADSPEASETPVWNHFQEVYYEEALFLQLQAEEVNEAIAQEALDVMIAAYHRFSFRAIIRIGGEVLAKATAISPETKASIHGLVGSAGTFYQFSHHANPPFDDFLVYHLEAALAIEKRPAHRSAMFYRLAFTYAERREDLPNARLWAQKGVDEATLNATQLQRDYHLAWALNVRAYINAFQGDIEACGRDAEVGWALLKNQIDRLESEGDPAMEYWLKDFKMSLFNLSIHQVYDGDELDLHDYSRAWFPRMKSVMDTMPKMLRFDTFHWVDYHRNKLAFNDALTASIQGMEDGKAMKHGQLYVYAFCAGDLAYRIGKLEDAARYFQTANHLRPQYNDLFGFISMAWFQGNCALRLNRLTEAEALFSQQLTPEISLDSQIKLKAKLAEIAALKGEKAEAETLLNEAIDLAVDYGERNLLLVMATQAGRCALILQDPEAAKDAFDQAIELSQSFGVPAEAFDTAFLLDLYMGLMEMNGFEVSMALKTLELLPSALDNIESWWHLPAMVSYVEQLKKLGTEKPANRSPPSCFGDFHPSLPQSASTVDFP